MTIVVIIWVVVRLRNSAAEPMDAGGREPPALCNQLVTAEFFHHGACIHNIRRMREDYIIIVVGLKYRIVLLNKRKDRPLQSRVVDQ